MTIEIKIRNVKLQHSIVSVIENGTLQDLIEARKHAKILSKEPDTWVGIHFIGERTKHGLQYYCDETYFSPDWVEGWYDSLATGAFRVKIR